MTAVGRVAVVSGGARGLGRACVLRLAQEGATVIVVDLPGDALVTAGEAGVGTAVSCDVSDPEQVTAVSAAVQEQFGRCDILVNNAGIFPPHPFSDLSYEEFRRVMTVNVDSMFLMSKAFGPGMCDRGWGRIVNMGSSITGSQSRDLLAYMTSKGAVHALTRALANELGSAGVTVNAIAPSFIATEGTRFRETDVAGMSFEEEQGLLVSLQTLQRPQTPVDVANALAFLVSPDAAFITGQVLHVDGGMWRSGA